MYTTRIMFTHDDVTCPQHPVFPTATALRQPCRLTEHAPVWPLRPVVKGLCMPYHTYLNENSVRMHKSLNHCVPRINCADNTYTVLTASICRPLLPLYSFLRDYIVSNLLVLYVKCIVSYFGKNISKTPWEKA